MDFFDGVRETIEDTEASLGDTTMMSNKRIDKLKRPCVIIDEIVDEFDTSSVDCEVSVNNGSVTIHTTHPDIAFLGEWRDKFYELVSLSSYFSFSKVDGEDEMRFSIVFDNLWGKEK